MYSHAFIPRLKTGVFPHGFYKYTPVGVVQNVAPYENFNTVRDSLPDEQSIRYCSPTLSKPLICIISFLMEIESQSLADYYFVSIITTALLLPSIS